MQQDSRCAPSLGERTWGAGHDAAGTGGSSHCALCFGCCCVIFKLLWVANGRKISDFCLLSRSIKSVKWDSLRANEEHLQVLP